MILRHRLARARAALAACLLSVVFGPVPAPAAALRWYIADLKPSFPESNHYSPATALTLENYRPVLDGLKLRAGANGVRLPILPDLPSPDLYSGIYRAVVDYARAIGLAIYASPLSTGMKPYRDWSDRDYSAWLAGYVRSFRPDFLSPFNEAGLSGPRQADIVAMLRAMLPGGGTAIVGPDRQHVERTLAEFTEHPALARSFDIVSSHNAERDLSATTANWQRLIALAGPGRPVWNSEDPRGWESEDDIPGIGSAVAAGVEGVVVWMAKPGLVDDAGQPTQKALAIAAHLAPAAR